MISELAHHVGQQRQRPAPPTGGRLAACGRHKQGFLLAVSLRSAPGHGSSRDCLLRSGVWSNKRWRRLLWRSGQSPRRAADVGASKIWARLSLRAACLPPLSIAVSFSRSAWLNSTRYGTFIVRLPVGVRTKRSMSQKSGARFTEKQGHYLAFIYTYSHMFGRPPAEADMQRHRC